MTCKEGMNAVCIVTPSPFRTYNPSTPINKGVELARSEDAKKALSMQSPFFNSECFKKSAERKEGLTIELPRTLAGAPFDFRAEYGFDEV
jgi:hypothetical protein